MIKGDKTQKQNVGNAGEYYVASRLSAMDFTVTITLGRAEKYDILAVNHKDKVLKLSIKTTQLEDSTGFPLSKKDEEGASDDFYYVFVKLNNFQLEPDFWVIPSKVVCPILKDSHKKWEDTPGKKGQEHSKVNSMRWLPVKIRGSDSKYYSDNWADELKKYYKNLNQLY